MENNTLLLLSIARFGFLSLNEKLTLYRSTASARQFSELRREGVERLIERRLKCRTFDPPAAVRAAEVDRKRLTHEEIEYTFYEEPDYPPQLREIHDPPFLLFYRGKLPDYEIPLLGIVGTRRPTGRAAKAAFRLGYDAGLAGLDVVSGLARGIDGFAHEGNVAGGGRSVAVLGCGIDTVYPAQNRYLGARILQGGGAIVSEYPPGEPPLPYHFPARNRIISGLCRGIVVVEAPGRSGALITAEHALDQGRDLFVHRDGMIEPNGSGTKRLVEAGAPVVEGIDGVLREWGYEDVIPAEMVGTTASNLSSTMRGELSGELMNHRGNYFRRVGNG